MWRTTSIRRAACILLTLSAAACGRDDPSRSGEAEPDSLTSPSDTAPVGLRHERAFAFAAVEGDSLVLVPVLFEARAGPETVVRRVRGWLGRAGTWEEFVDQSWQDGATGAARRIVPRGPIRLVVGEGDAVETILYRQPPRVLELDLGEGLAEWTGARGGAYRLEETTLLLGNRRFGGIALDMARSRTANEPPAGDWAFLVSGDSLQVVLHAPEQAEPDTEAAWTAFVRIDFRQIQWPEVTLDWSRTQAFEPARRDVPAAWRFRSRAEEITGELDATSAQLSAGETDGPVLPVSALFGVRGTVSVDGVDYPVRGLFRHARE